MIGKNGRLPQARLNWPISGYFLASLAGCTLLTSLTSLAGSLVKDSSFCSRVLF